MTTDLPCLDGTIATGISRAGDVFALQTCRRMVNEDSLLQVARLQRTP
jgi:hypothetical protein